MGSVHRQLSIYIFMERQQHVLAVRWGTLPLSPIPPLRQQILHCGHVTVSTRKYRLIRSEPDMCVYTRRFTSG